MVPQLVLRAGVTAHGTADAVHHPHPGNPPQAYVNAHCHSMMGLPSPRYSELPLLSMTKIDSLRQTPTSHPAHAPGPVVRVLEMLSRNASYSVPADTGAGLGSAKASRILAA